MEEQKHKLLSRTKFYSLISLDKKLKLCVVRCNKDKYVSTIMLTPKDVKMYALKEYAYEMYVSNFWDKRIIIRDILARCENEEERAYISARVFIVELLNEFEERRKEEYKYPKIFAYNDIEDILSKQKTHKK